MIRPTDCVCGASVRAGFLFGRETYRVDCGNCGRKGPESPNIDVAVLKWNETVEGGIKYS